MVTLYAFGPALGIIDPSPFVLKIDAFMRLADIEFESIGSLRNLQKAQKGKLPFIKDGEDIICDSFFILKHLTKKYKVSLDSHLSSEQHTQVHFVSKATEESLYWCAVYFRWIYPKNWQIIKKLFFGKMPFPLNKIVPLFAQKDVKKALHGQGLGRHTEKEILIIAKNHLDALSILIGNKKYCFGDKPCSLDAIVYAFLAEIILVNIESPLSEMANTYENLVNYCNHFHKEYYA